LARREQVSRVGVWVVRAVWSTRHPSQLNAIKLLIFGALLRPLRGSNTRGKQSQWRTGCSCEWQHTQCSGWAWVPRRVGWRRRVSLAGSVGVAPLGQHWSISSIVVNGDGTLLGLGCRRRPRRTASALSHNQSARSRGCRSTVAERYPNCLPLPATRRVADYVGSTDFAVGCASGSSFNLRINRKSN